MFNAQNNIDPLASTTVLVNGIYYAMQTINGCTSATPLAVQVNINLANANFDRIGLEYYPNPVKTNLNLSYTEDIDSVSVYNLLGQKIKFIQPNTPSIQIEMSTFPEGTYILQIEANGKHEVIKILKK